MIILACFEHGLNHRWAVVALVAFIVPQEAGECGLGEQPASHCGQVFVTWRCEDSWWTYSMVNICVFLENKCIHRYIQ